MKISPAQIKLLRNIEATEAKKKAMDYPKDRAIDPNYEPTEGAIAYGNNILGTPSNIFEIVT